MNKATKGAIAAGAAGILLLGGAGTFALWEDSKDIEAGTVSTGQLELDVPVGDWADVTSGSPAEITDITAFKLVPGDILTYTTTVTATATGDNLHGELKIEGMGAFNTLAGEHVTATVAHTAVDGGGLLVDGNNMTFVESAIPYEFDVTITVAFSDEANELEDQSLAVILPDLALTLEQS
jgi:alternate signal-mediated exported protein